MQATTARARSRILVGTAAVILVCCAAWPWRSGVTSMRQIAWEDMNTTSFRTPSHFVTFADGKFNGSLQRLRYEADSLAFFETVNAYDALALGPEFHEQHDSFIQGEGRRGFGYWVWKPHIVLDTMAKHAADGDVVVYMDVGCTINAAGRSRLEQYISIASSWPDGLVAFQLGHKEYTWTKEDTLARLRCDKHCRETGQVIGTVFFIRKSQANIQFLQRMAAVMVEDGYHFVSNAPSKAPNHETFQEHRHDQSIFSIMTKQRSDAVILQDETYEIMSGKFSGQPALTYPIWATRNKQRDWNPPA